MAKQKSKLSPEERKKRAKERAFKRQARSIFQKCGFVRVADAADREFTYGSLTTDFDDVFVHENLIVFAEYTLSNESGTGEHFKNKAHIYKNIFDNPKSFINFFQEEFIALEKKISKKYHKDQLIMRVVYFSEHEVKSAHQTLEPRVTFAWRSIMQYFRSLADIVEKSARHELFNFLGVSPEEVGENGAVLETGGESPYPGSLLPEAHSEFPTGYKLVSFYVTPKALLRRAYVLRRDGWMDSEGLYQRMIDKKKIRSIRTHLKEKKRVFVNNVVVTLPHDARLDDDSGIDIDPAAIDKTKPVSVKLRDRPNSVGIIDGQHRIFAYYEGVTDDADIANFRDRQNMLATGIIYPKDESDAKKQEFEAQLFLEINSTQNSAKSDLKQAISVIVRPFSDESIGKRIVSRLSREGALEGRLQKSYFDVGVLKTSSIVSFALARLVRISGDESLFKHVKPEMAAAILKGDLGALSEYVDFCSSELRKFLGAAKANLDSQKWEIKTKKGSGVLTVTTVNAFIILFRKVVERDGLADFEHYKKKLSGLSGFKFGSYHSSQYNRMADAMLKNVYDA
ncbi:MAG: DGQHR domain-containing protein [Sphingopyxis granuli]